MSEVIEKVRSKGYWDIRIRPASFAADRLSRYELPKLLRGAVVRFRGWPVPFIDDRAQFVEGADWIGQDIDAEVVSHYEAWRFFTSGQFTQLRSVSADWRVGAERTRIPSGFSSVVEVWEILFFLTEVYELAARLALSPAGDDRMVIDTTLVGTSQRALIVGQTARGEFAEPYRAHQNKVGFGFVVPRDALVADASFQAAEAALTIFEQFGWRPTLEQLQAHQEELTYGR